MSSLDAVLIPAVADASAPIRGVALLGLVVVGGVGGVLTIVLIAWSRHRRTAAQAAGKAAGRPRSRASVDQSSEATSDGPLDPWRESARRWSPDSEDSPKSEDSEP